MSRVRAQMIAQIAMILRVLQAISGVVILLCLITSYTPVILADASKAVADPKQYIAAQPSHFFLAIAAYSSFVFGMGQLVFEHILSRVRTDALLERCVDGGLAAFFLVMGIVVAPQMGCAASRYQNCTSFQVSVVFAFLSAVLFGISLAFNVQNKTVVRANPDSTENLVPRGRYGRGALSSDAVLESQGAKQAKTKAQATAVDDDDLALVTMPRGNFGSVRATDVSELKQYHEEYAAEDVYFNSRIDLASMAKTKNPKLANKDKV
ncbi:Aste57867_8972 [Aphanomyces stellatus]|uniref:Aste57867_8972 protein n=1 Tax=Aphanomyces stellatus TaxID=120398 RepID=A0A485KLR0_9STRA|nr:hypothetical protein As57867_008937 [Aphanomyces stellatus]VFT85856.1 Aste57867_8972 [Aphanomyces stellatus]